MAPGYWFRPKRWGYGAVPVTWQGWAATVVYAAVALVATLGYGAAVAVASTGPAIAATAIYLGFVVLWTLGFVSLARARTDGRWAWRWNSDETGPAPLGDTSREPADGPDATDGH
tara:strand:+ start:2554 stop:2898 length:345 start_codon:yes stop_codon:yes gene_type:complete